MAMEQREGRISCRSWGEASAIVILNALCLANLWVDDISRPLRLSFYLIAFAAALGFNRATLYVILASCCWFEIPSLLLGFPNQFVIEFAVLGFLAGSLLKEHCRLGGDSLQMTPHRRHDLLIYYPLTLPALACIFYGICSLPPMLGELAGLNGVPLAVGKTLERALRVGFDWNPREPLHSVSLINGYALHLVFLAYLINRSSYYCWTTKVAVKCLLWGALPISAYAVAQYLAPDLFLPPFHQQVVSSLQGGNSLSFYMGFVLIGSLFLADQAKGWGEQRLAYATMAAAFFPFLLGRGRTAWLAFALALLGALALHIYAGGPWLRPKGSWRRQYRFLLIGALGLGAVSLGVALVWSWIGWEVSQTLVQYQEAISAGQWIKLLIPPGRYEDYQTAWAALRSEPWFGIGLGNYFVKNPASYDLHSMLLALPVQLGLAGLVVLVLTAAAMVRYALICLRTFGTAEPLARIGGWGVLFLTYVVATFAYDVFLTYRTLALSVGTVLVAVICERFSSTEPSRLERQLGWVLCLGTCLLSVTMSMASMFTPLTHYDLFRVYPKEASIGTPFPEFEWASFADAAALGSGQCLTQWMKPIANFTEKGGGLLVGASPSLPERHYKVRKLLAWEGEKLINTVHMFLWTGQWSKVCICQTKSEATALYLRGHQVRTYAFIEDSNSDHRMLAFAFAERQVLSQQDFDKSQAAARTEVCDQVIIL